MRKFAPEKLFYILLMIKRILIGLMLTVTLLVAATAFTGNPKRDVLTVGSEVPSLQIVSATNGTMSAIGGTSDEYTLVTFWKSSDAPSRMACNKYQASMRGESPFLARYGGKVRFVAVNLDSSKALFREIVENDRLDATNQFVVEDVAVLARLDALFALRDGMGSVLIAPDGTVAAFNP